MINKDEVKHIAKLARVGLTEKEEEKMAKELSSVLDYIDTLNELDVSNIDPTFYPTKLENVKREDVVFSDDAKKMQQTLLNNQNNYLKVKQVFDNGGSN